VTKRYFMNRSEIMASTLRPMTNRHDEYPSNLGQAGAASPVAQTDEDTAAYLGRKADDATTAVGGGLKSLGNSIRAHSPDGEAFSAVADTLERRAVTCRKKDSRAWPRN
jgi:hypothetical protein